jgi:hypothetical protein
MTIKERHERNTFATFLVYVLPFSCCWLTQEAKSDRNQKAVGFPSEVSGMNEKSYDGCGRAGRRERTKVAPGKLQAESTLRERPGIFPFVNAAFNNSAGLLEGDGSSPRSGKGLISRLEALDKTFTLGNENPLGCGRLPLRHGLRQRELERSEAGLEAPLCPAEKSIPSPRMISPVAEEGIRQDTLSATPPFGRLPFSRYWLRLAPGSGAPEGGAG